MDHNLQYPKGSEWRKWDLHVHTKSDSSYKYDSIASISDREKSDDEYPKVFIEHIYKIDNLGVLAITDHNKADWLDKIIHENEEYVSSNDKEKITIFPGLEIESHDGIHLLVLFNPDSKSEEVNKSYRKKTWKETIEHFLTAIEVTPDSNASLKTEEILELSEKWDAICIFAHTTSDKGYFTISSGTTRQKIYKHRLTQIFQVPVRGISKNGWRNIINGEDPNYCNEVGKLKSVVCINASDAKNLKNIATNNCWIKSDPTFEGLQQIIYEPEERTYFGEEPPRKVDRNRIIKSITFDNTNGWFKDKENIPLNENLVSIIGGKGSGKTAIIDLIAYAAESYRSYEKNAIKSKSFLKKAFKEIEGLKIKLEWEEGSPSEIIVLDKLQEFHEEGRIRYLPQDFIDQLCSEIGKEELEKQIENVIFQKIPAEYKANIIDFISYKSARLKVINDKKDRVSDQIDKINSKIYEYKILSDSLQKKEKEKSTYEDEIVKLDSRMEKISEGLKKSSKQQILLIKLNGLIKQKSGIEKKISDLSNQVLKVEEMLNNINVILGELQNNVEDIKAKLKQIEIDDETIQSFKIVLQPENIESLINKRKLEISKEKEKYESKLISVNKNIDSIHSKIEFERSKKESIDEINDLLSIQIRKLDSLEEEIKTIKQVKRKLPDLIKERDNLFIRYFELIFEEKEKLKEIYSSLESILRGSEEENERLFNFAVKFDFDVENMVDEGYRLIDLRKEGKFTQSTKEVLKREIEKLKFTLDLNSEEISDKDKERIKKFSDETINLFTEGDRKISCQIKDRYTELDFLNWLFNTKYYEVNYSIKFNNIDLDNLSPGLKGVALLILFLELDKEDKRPILIDQPEENLDNRSVYHTLVKYFRNSKKRRQVIIVTHNPNLVVNTDSEQIIVANFDGSKEKQDSKICYKSGSLEDTYKLREKDFSADQWKKLSELEKYGIREHVCEILEGGKEAFEKRERKYGFKGIGN